MRSLGTGSISFGLINIPIRLYSASQEHPISFDFLHKKDLSPIRYAKICKEEEKEVPFSEIVKGYEYEKGHYVVMEEEKHEGFKTIEIKQFASVNEVDFVLLERPYYLEPGKGADKAYALLRETLKASKKVAIVKFVFRNKEHLGLLKEYRDLIVLDQMRFLEEIRSAEDLKLPSKNLVGKKEIDMSLKLVAQLTHKFDPKNYKDESRRKLKQKIDKKVKTHGKIKRKKKSSKVHDITSLLEESLKERRKRA